MRDPCWNQQQLRDFHGYLYTVNNGTMDVEGFIDSEYGAETARRLQIRSRIEYDHEEAKRYYATVGLNKEYFDWNDYYDRWTLLTPMDMEPGKKYPLVFWLHGGGNSIEAEENMTGFTDIAAQEGFMLACPQNTSPEKVLQIMDRVAELYPLDRGRVYLAGFSQGGAQSRGAYFRNPELFADCGIETGYDAFKALALGADAVCIARPLRPLFTEGGAEAIQKKLTLMTDELRLCLSKTASPDIRHISPNVLKFL